MLPLSRFGLVKLTLAISNRDYVEWIEADLIWNLGKLGRVSLCSIIPDGVITKLVPVGCVWFR